jgi:hypothetical protein
MIGCTSGDVFSRVVLDCERSMKCGGLGPTWAPFSVASAISAGIHGFNLMAHVHRRMG